jgi:hypothetical protein
MLAKRYGKLPTETLPRGTVPRHFELAFNLNTALLGAISEHNAVNKQHEGPIKSRADARAAIELAKADWYEMEEGRKRRA